MGFHTGEVSLNSATSILEFALKNKTTLNEAARQLKKSSGVIRNVKKFYRNPKDTNYKKFIKLYDKFSVSSGDIDTSIYNKKEFRKITDELSGFKRFFITTAVADQPVSESSLTSVKNYCRLRNAALIVLPANNEINKIAPSLKYDSDLFVVYDDMKLNNNFRISTIKLTPKQIDPITGLDRLGQRDGSFIFASPKQRLKYIATSNNKLPHCLMTTGAITLPRYEARAYKELRLSEIARHDHVMGGIIVEIESNDVYHFRQVQFNSRGSFIDLGIEYSKDSTKDVSNSTLVLGDLHCADLDPIAFQNSMDLADSMDLRNIVLHDVFDGKSISHWTKDKKVYRAKQYEEGKLNLKKEIDHLVGVLNQISEKADKIYIVKSNHDEFLDRYLEDGRYIKEAHNYKYAARLVDRMMWGDDPLKFACEDSGLKNQNKFIWLKRDSDFKVAGIQLGAHGDRGGNGSRGSTKQMESGYGDSVSAHSHSPEVLRSAWRVGTLSVLDPDYTTGSPSSWFHTNCIVYPNGMRQLINVINGSYKMSDSTTK